MMQYTRDWKTQVLSTQLPGEREGFHQGRLILESWLTGEMSSWLNRNAALRRKVEAELAFWTTASFQEILPPGTPQDRWNSGVKPWVE